MFESYVKTCARDKDKKLDWLHLNSIYYVDGDVYLSSRETSSILKISNIESNPKLEYILAEEKIWKNTEYSDYVYKKVGNFKIHAGQHKVTYKKGESEGVYYLTFFNNNFGQSKTRPNLDFKEFEVTNQSFLDGDTSYYYVYKVDENKKAFELVDSFDVAYSSFVSSVQDLDNGNTLVDSGVKGKYVEYDNKHNAIRTFYIDLNEKFIYRVLKYDYKQIWFN